MKIRILVSISLVFFLSACHSKFYRDNDKPVNLKLDESINIHYSDGRLVAVDEKGEVISKEVKLPIRLNDKGSSPVKTLSSVQEFTLITIKGTCDAYVKFGSQYIHVPLPDGHPWCNR